MPARSSRSTVASSTGWSVYLRMLRRLRTGSSMLTSPRGIRTSEGARASRLGSCKTRRASARVGEEDAASVPTGRPGWQDEGPGVSRAPALLIAGSFASEGIDPEVGLARRRPFDRAAGWQTGGPAHGQRPRAGNGRAAADDLGRPPRLVPAPHAAATAGLPRDRRRPPAALLAAPPPAPGAAAPRRPRGLRSGAWCRRRSAARSSAAESVPPPGDALPGGHSLTTVTVIVRRRARRRRLPGPHVDRPSGRTCPPWSP